MTIHLLSALPVITEAVDIEGKTTRNAPAPAGVITLNKPVITPADGQEFRVFEVVLPFAKRKDPVGFYWVEIAGGTATGDGGPFGGGIKSTNADLWVENCVLRNNHADTNGGGIWANGLTCEITLTGSDTSVIGNDAGAYGGGISVLDAYLKIKKGAQVVNNDAGVGGGGVHVLVDGGFEALPAFTQRVLFLDGSANRVNVTCNNALNGDGGGVLVVNNGFFPGAGAPITEVKTATISGNTAVGTNGFFGQGGGIAVMGMMEFNADTATTVSANGQTAAVPGTVPFKLGVYLQNAVFPSTFATNADMTDDNYLITP